MHDTEPSVKRRERGGGSLTCEGQSVVGSQTHEATEHPDGLCAAQRVGFEGWCQRRGSLPKGSSIDQQTRARRRPDSTKYFAVNLPTDPPFNVEPVLRGMAVSAETE